MQSTRRSEGDEALPTAPARSPSASGRPKRTPRPPARAPAPEPAAKVLIADPDPDVLASTALLAGSLGFEPLPVSDPAEILEAVLLRHPGLVLVEPQFPGLNLSGLVAALRSQPETAAIPIAFLSSSKDLAATVARHQVWGSLAKPFTVRELGTLLTRALGPSRAMVEAGTERSIEREVRATFHDYRNLITAVGNYLAILDRTPDLPPPARMAVNRLAELALKMESKTEHLRSYVLSLILPYALADLRAAPHREDVRARREPDAPTQAPQGEGSAPSMPGQQPQ